jgi:hypothetical protein
LEDAPDFASHLAAVRFITQTMLYHFSEEPGIERFEPRASATSEKPVVWAVSEAKLRNYLLPRDCPRVTFFAGERTTAEDRARLLGASEIVVAFESGWLERVRKAKLFCYRFPESGFNCVDSCAGYFQNSAMVVPLGMDMIDDCVAALISRGVEIHVIPSLWELHDAVVNSTLSYSIIRMRNAAPRPYCL